MIAKPPTSSASLDLLSAWTYYFLNDKLSLSLPPRKGKGQRKADAKCPEKNWETQEHGTMSFVKLAASASEGLGWNTRL